LGQFLDAQKRTVGEGQRTTEEDVPKKGRRLGQKEGLGMMKTNCVVKEVFENAEGPRTGKQSKLKKENLGRRFKEGWVGRFRVITKVPVYASFGAFRDK